jgi:LPS-assembly protein
MRDWRLLAALLLLWALAPVAAGQERRAPLAESEQIAIDAEEISYDQKTGTVVARGAVVITRGATELRADEVRIHRATNEAAARGGVRLTSPEGMLEAEEMWLNLDEETGLLEHAEITSRQFQYSLRGDRVRKGLGQSYRIENGQFTSCKCAEGPPSWSISGKEVEVTVGGYGRLSGGTFNVLDVPIIYVPRAVFPAQRERQSGFLLPRFSVSNRRGFQIVEPFFWAIDKSQDVTLALDLETSARAGLIGEYRYVLGRGMQGVVAASYFNESLGGAEQGPVFEPSIPENRWSVVTEQDQALGGSTRAYADVFIVSDDLFLRDMNTYAFEHAREVGIRTLPFTTSRAGVLHVWDRLAVKGEGTYYQDLTSTQSPTLQRAPEIDAWGLVPFGESAFGELTASAVDFQRAQGVEGFRLDIEPSATVPLPLGRLAFGSVQASLRETAYHLTQTRLNPGEQSPGLQRLPANQSRELLEVRGQVGTALNHVYPVRWLGLGKVKHTLEPTLEYLYVPTVAQDEQPLFDGIDRVNRRNLLTYGLVSRLIGKFSEAVPAEADAEDYDDESDAPEGPSTGAIRELGRLSLYQSVDIRREIDPLQVGRAADHFSDIDFGGRVNPSRFLSFRFLTNYDTGNNNIDAARFGLFVEDPRTVKSGPDAPRLDTRTSAGVSYRVLTENLLQEIDGNFVVRLTNWAGLFYATRYDLVVKRFLDTHVGLRLISTCDCWALDVGVTDRTNPQEVEVRAQLTLVGFGTGQPRSRVARTP